MGHRIVVIGSGMCGMFTAIALSQQGHRVLVLERDGEPPGGSTDDAFFEWQRRGAAQFRHPHAFLGLMCGLIERHYPVLLDGLYEAGARRLSFHEMLPPGLRQRYQPEPDDDQLWVLLCRRATVETVVRRYVEALAGVELRSGVKVTGLQTLGEVHPRTVTGVRLESGEEITADVVIDASGRRSQCPRWLRDMGVVIPEEKHDAQIVYYTKHYRLLPGQSEPPRGEQPASGDLGYLKFGVFPGDNGHFAVILCVPVDERELRRAVACSETFDRICLQIPGVRPWVAPDVSDATTESFGIGDIRAVWRDYAPDDVPLVHNFYAVGDASVRTNPLYGRGCSTGILHAKIVADVLQEYPDPNAAAIEFAQRTRRSLRPIWQASLTEDKNGIRRAAAIKTDQALDKATSMKSWFGLAFGDALSAAVRDEMHVVRGLMRTVNLLEKPGAFLQDKAIKRTVFRYMLRGRRRNARSRLQPGPSRREMILRVS